MVIEALHSLLHSPEQQAAMSRCANLASTTTYSLPSIDPETSTIPAPWETILCDLAGRDAYAGGVTPPVPQPSTGRFFREDRSWAYSGWLILSPIPSCSHSLPNAPWPFPTRAAWRRRCRW